MLSLPACLAFSGGLGDLGENLEQSQELHTLEKRDKQAREGKSGQQTPQCGQAHNTLALKSYCQLWSTKINMLWDFW